MEELKPKDALCVPDDSHARFVCFDRSINDWRPRTLDDHYAAISQIRLIDTVPELIRRSFATARNLLLYAWFEYPFIVVAELQAIGCLELALKWRLESAPIGSKRGLRRCMHYAITQGLLQDEGIADAARATVGNVDLLEAIGLSNQPEVESIDPQAYVKTLAVTLPGLRNELAHGTPMLYPGGYATLGVIARTINQLWTRTGAKPEGAAAGIHL